MVNVSACGTPGGVEMVTVSALGTPGGAEMMNVSAFGTPLCNVVRAVVSRLVLNNRLNNL